MVAEIGKRSGQIHSFKIGMGSGSRSDVTFDLPVITLSTSFGWTNWKWVILVKYDSIRLKDIVLLAQSRLLCSQQFYYERSSQDDSQDQSLNCI